MKIVLGATGGLGRILASYPDVVGVTRTDCDVTSEGAVALWMSYFDSVQEPIHILNATGLSISSMLHKSEMYEESWNRMVQVNLLGNARLLKYLRPVFKERPGSTFTMLGSVTTKLGPAGAAVYTATKSALEGLTRTAAREFAPFARVNLLELGYFDQGMIKQVKDVNKLIETVPLKRLGTAEDLWQAWQFVIACQYVTGAVIPVNGGLA